MIFRYIAASALTLAAALLLTAGSAARTRPHPRPSAAPLNPAKIYSGRALRRARIILELKLLELREERLEGVRKAIERHVPIDRILSDPKGG